MHFVAHGIDLFQSPQDSFEDLEFERTLLDSRYEPPKDVLDLLFDGLLNVDRFDSQTLP
jgi:hypothetical protein